VSTLSRVLALLLLMPSLAWAQADVTQALVPNRSAAAFEPQARLFSQDLQIIVSALAGYGVASGCAVTPQGTPNMTVAVAAGSLRTPTGTVSVTGGNLTVATANGTSPRIDLVTASPSGGSISITAGTAAANPIPPAIPRAGGIAEVVLAAVYVPAGAATITGADLVDKRVASAAGGLGPGTINTLAKFTDTHAVGDSLLTDDGALLTYSGDNGLVLNSLGDAQVGALAASGANQAGIDFAVRAGPGTGSGTGGTLRLQTAPAGGAGSTPNAPVDRLTISEAGVTTLPGLGGGGTQMVTADNTGVLGVAPSPAVTSPAGTLTMSDGAGHLVASSCVEDATFLVCAKPIATSGPSPSALSLTEGAAADCPTPTAGLDIVCAVGESTHALQCSYDGASYISCAATGTVTSIATTAPITGGTITTTGTIGVSDFVASGSSHARGTVPDPGASSGTTKFLREDASWQVPPNSGGTVTSVATGAGLTGGTITTTGTLDLAAAYKVRTCTVIIGDPGSASAALANDNDSPVSCVNEYGVDWTIQTVSCWADAGSPTVTPILTGGSATSILTGALTCGTAAWASGTVQSSPPVVHSFSGTGSTCTSTPCSADVNITTAGGTAKYVVVRISGSLP
jgi:hypothetical protein